MEIRKILKSKKHGFTLIEIIIGLAIAFIVGEIIFGTFITTDRASNKSNSRVMLYNEGRLIENQIFQILKKNIPSSEIIKPGSQNPESFNAREVKVFSPDIKSDKYAPRLITIKNQLAPDGKKHRIIAYQENFDPETNQVAEAGAKDLGAQTDAVSARVVFRYATQYNELEPQYVDSITTSTAPRLVQYTITLEDVGKDYESVSMTSAVAF